jgi:signal transduction histidine kinase
MRITQEALINVYRHAEATKVTITLSSTSRGLVLTIEDNGKGFGSNVVANALDEVETLGVGIPGMRARVRQLDGELFIESSSQGVRIRAVIPQNPACLDHKETVPQRQRTTAG